MEFNRRATCRAMGECEITWGHYAVTGSIKLGSLFLTLPTRWLTGHQIISAEG